MTDNPAIMLVAMPIAAYVIGATPFGVMIARAKGIDLRRVGSGNVGATNVGRTIGKKWGLLCFVLDVAKGLGPTLAAGIVLKQDPDFPTLLHQAAWIGVGFGAIAGHVFSFWLRFRGGKGVATSMGVIIGIYPYFTWPGLCALAVWVLVTLVSRHVSLGSIIAALAFVPLFAAFRRAELASLWPLLAFASVVVVLIIVRHRSNIARLFAGSENRIGQPKSGG